MEVTRVVLQRHRRLVRELGNEVTTANFVLRQAHFPGSARNDALQQISSLWSACTPVGIHWGGVGEPGIHLHIDLWRLVLTRQQRGVKDGRHSGGEGREISTQVGVGVDTEAQELAIFVHRQFGVADVVTAMGVRQESLRAVAIPLDGSIELFGSPGQAHIFGVQVNLGTKATAHIGRNHAHFVFWQAHHKCRQKQAFDVRVLVGDIQGVIVTGTVVVPDGGTWFHGVGRQAVVDQVELGHMRCIGKCGINGRLVTNGPLVALVVGGDIVNHRRTRGLCIAHIHHRGQGFVIHHHQLGGVAGLFVSFCHDHGHMVTHVTHFFEGQNWVWRLFHGFAVGAGDQPAARQAVDFVCGHILAIQNPDDARRRQGSRFVDAANFGVGVG